MRVDTSPTPIVLSGQSNLLNYVEIPDIFTVITDTFRTVRVYALATKSLVVAKSAQRLSARTAQ